MPERQSFRDLRVWLAAMALAEEVYTLTRAFPPEERYGLSSQLRRAAVSVPANIGEGARRKRRRAFLYHLDVALGSQGEVEVLVELAARLKFCRPDAALTVLERAASVGRMLNRLIGSLQLEEDSTTSHQPRATN